MEKPAVEYIRALNADERQKAKDKARDLVAGKKPTKKGVVITQELPENITKTIQIFCWIVLVSAFIPSGARIFDAGANAFKEGINSFWLAAVVGICSIFLAEIGQVVCTLALSLVEDKFSKTLLWVSAVTFTIWALVGNYITAHPQPDKPFSYLEATVPTIMVLTMAYILKVIDLKKIKEQHKFNIEFTNQGIEWQKVHDTAESQPSWLRHYAEALKEAIRIANNKRKDSKEALDELNQPGHDEDWKFLIKREIDADNWFSDLVSDKPKPVENTPVPEKEPFVKNGEELGYVQQLADKTWDSYCHQHGKLGNYATQASCLIGFHKHANHSHTQIEN